METSKLAAMFARQFERNMRGQIRRNKGAIKRKDKFVPSFNQV